MASRPSSMRSSDSTIDLLRKANKMKGMTITVILLLAAFVLSSCSGGRAAIEETWTVIKLAQSGEDTRIVPMIVEVSSCTELENKTVTCSAGTGNQISAGISGELGVNLGLLSTLQSSIMSAFEANRSTGETLTLEPAPVGFINRYVIEKRFVVINGEAAARSARGTEIETDFSFDAACSMRILSKEQIECGPKPVAVASPNPPSSTDAKTLRPAVTPKSLATPTLLPTNQTVPTETLAPPTNTPPAQLRFQPVAIRQVANASTQEGYGSPPLGTVELGGATFTLPTGTNSVTTQSSNFANNPVRIELGVDLLSPEQVHLLITGGNVFSEYVGQQIGLIRLRFATSPSVTVPLIAGHNIREWKLLDEHTVSTVTDSSIREVWRTASTHGGEGVIDMLTIDLGSRYQSDRLVGIEVIDTSLDALDNRDPAINLIGVSVLAR